MTLKSVDARLAGFSYRYSGVVDDLNSIYNSSSLCNNDLEDVGRAVSDELGCRFSHNVHDLTTDGYFWFGSMEFTIDRTPVHILFPWAQDWDDPESQLDRSIEVYAKRSIPKEKVMQLTDRIAHYMSKLSKR